MVNLMPTWSPYKTTLRNARSYNFRIRYKALRNSSSYFIGRIDVKKIIYSKYNGKCYICGSEKNLQIDHIVSVYRYAKDRIEPLSGLNSFENLALICGSCNSSKPV